LCGNCKELARLEEPAIWVSIPDLPGREIPDDWEAVQLAPIGIDHADDPKPEGDDSSDDGDHPADNRNPPQDPQYQAHAAKEYEGLQGMKTHGRARSRMGTCRKGSLDSTASALYTLEQT
jgi:hypothetical protein